VQNHLLELDELMPMFADFYPDDTLYSHISAKIQMEHTDTDKDGKLSLQELIAAKQFIYPSIDPDPHHLKGWPVHDEF
jgi:hypothetical protein